MLHRSIEDRWDQVTSISLDSNPWCSKVGLTFVFLWSFWKLRTSRKKLFFRFSFCVGFSSEKLKSRSNKRFFFQPMMKKKEKIFSFSHFRSNSEISLQPSQVVSPTTFSLQCSASTFLIYLLQPQFRLQAFKKASNMCWERRFQFQD